ncbi:ATP-binding protein [Candidatus Poriferisodalis sp.]|uniref:ATP-binding protein n=1 Tax=Candidatus Poriferisodalis sp. TaxID=3101277 RepID=UPI003B0133E8
MSADEGFGATSTLTPAGYSDRIAETNAARVLRTARALLIEGPKGCGKTWLAKRFASSEVLLEQNPAAFALAQAEPHRVLDGATPRLIDEWQRVPALWGVVRGACDARAAAGQFILTGSATPSDDLTRHSGALRIQRLALRTMSLAERGLSTREVSLAGLLRGEPAAAGPTGRGVPEAVDALCRGGWPGLGDSMSVRDVTAALRGYLEDIARTDIRQVDGVARDPVRVRALLRSLARNVGTAASLNKLAAEASAFAPLGRHSLRAYLDALERLHVLEPLTAWPTHLRSRTPLLLSPRHHFTDPSLAVAALRAQPEGLLADTETLGLLFESLVIRDLRIYAQAADAEVYAFRDTAGSEVDAIVDAGDGRWIAVEVKLGGSEQIEQAAHSLLHAHGKVDETKMGRATKLVVVTAADGYSYERPDGVSVVPLFALGP